MLILMDRKIVTIFAFVLTNSFSTYKIHVLFSPTDASAGYTQDRRPDHQILPPLYGNVRRSVLPSSRRAGPYSYKPNTDPSEVLSHFRCVCEVDCSAGETLRRDNQYCDKTKLTQQGNYLSIEPTLKVIYYLPSLICHYSTVKPV